MNKRTTDEWEALLDGWVHDKQSDTLLGSWVRSTQIRKQEQAAPEAVAEVVRLREELKELLDTLSKAKLDSTRGDYEYGQYTAFLMASSRITRILEGANDSGD